MANAFVEEFRGNPTALDISRSKFTFDFHHKTTFNAGLAIPVFAYPDILPGTTMKMGMNCFVRQATPIAPVMDHLYLDVSFFYVPYEKIWSRRYATPSINDEKSWRAFIGAQDFNLCMPIPASGIQVPRVNLNGLYKLRASDLSLESDYSVSSYEPHSLADYLGCGNAGLNGDADYGVGYGGQWISALPAMAYYAVWNDYYRDPNTCNPVTWSYGDAGDTVGDDGDLTGQDWSSSWPIVNFSGGPDIITPVVSDSYEQREYRWLNSADITEEAITVSSSCSIATEESILPVFRYHGYFGSALPWPQRNTDMVGFGLTSDIDVKLKDDYLKFSFNESGVKSGNVIKENTANNNILYLGANSENLQAITGTNQYVDLSDASAISVNALRLAVQKQRWYEALARGGNRYGELKSSMFGVSDVDDDRPEYLCGKRIPIQMEQVANTADATGTLGAYSATWHGDFLFTKSFTDWGIVLGIACVRYKDTFSQGINRNLRRFDKFDYYWPQFANLGEQPLLNSELYVADDRTYDDQVFGYQEAWAEYRMMHDVVSGHLRPGMDLEYWTYANKFDGYPTLSEFLRADYQRGVIDRTLKVPSTVSGFQFFAEFAFDITVVQPMPTYSIPGLVDHH